VNNSDVEVPNPGCKSKFDINCKFVPSCPILLVDWNFVPTTEMLIQEHVALAEIRFCCAVCVFAGTEA